ncbi:MAG: helix-turn-helix domain-containing protein [Oscillospiraceae bacterium]|nr:helix-turn-helix domain-containing protein [Oscillospiraceae bacterium]
MKDERKKLIVERFQIVSKQVRIAAGLSVDELAEELDFTKLTIQRIESGETKLQYVQYLGIRAFYDEIIREKLDKDPEDIALYNIFQLLDKCDEMTELEFHKLREATKVVSGAVLAGATATSVATVLKAIAFIPLIPIVGPFTIGVVFLINKMRKK